jgi:hypothetical protein
MCRNILPIGDLAMKTTDQKAEHARLKGTLGLDPRGRIPAPERMRNRFLYLAPPWARGIKQARPDEPRPASRPASAPVSSPKAAPAKQRAKQPAKQDRVAYMREYMREYQRKRRQAARQQAPPPGKVKARPRPRGVCSWSRFHPCGGA